MIQVFHTKMKAGGKSMLSAEDRKKVKAIWSRYFRVKAEIAAENKVRFAGERKTRRKAA